MANRLGSIRIPLEERFWAKVKKRKSGCWEWIGAISDGYGSIAVQKGDRRSRPQKAHHVSWFLFYGVWPTQWILHHCDNRKCVRPSHLYEGTGKNNADDREKRAQ